MEIEETYDALAFTAAALATQPGDEALRALHAKVSFALGQGDRLIGERRALGNEAIAARAHVRMADAALDRVLHRLAGALEGRGALYDRFFSEPHEEVIELGLDGELPAASAALAVLDESTDVPGTLKEMAPLLRGALTVGHAALAHRAEAYASLGRLDARLEAWHEDAEATLRIAHGRLERIAGERGLGLRWVAAFFE